VVEYYFNTPFPEIPSGVRDELVSKIASAKFMFVSGYHPDKRILDYLSEEVVLLCSITTNYDMNEKYDEDSFIYHLYQHPEKREIFSNIILYYHKALTTTTFEELAKTSDQYFKKYEKKIEANNIIRWH
jgi:hypothetical protein